MFSPAIETETGEKAAKEEAVVENTTPDYAAGLVSAQVPCSHITRMFMFLRFCLIFPSHFCFLLCFSVSIIASNVCVCFPETGGAERESSAVNQLPTGHTQHGSLLLLHSQLRGTARLDTQPRIISVQLFHICYLKETKSKTSVIISISQCLFLRHPPPKRMLAVRRGTRCSRLANQRSRRQQALAPPPPPPYQASTNKGRPCTTPATRRIQQPPRPPARRSLPPPAMGPQQRRPPASRRPPPSLPAHLRPRPPHQPLRPRSPSPKRICRSR